MSPRMSCSMTVPAVRARTKTVTRRHVDKWKNLKPGDRLTLIEKGMGLPKGARQVVLSEVEIVHVSIEPLSEIFYEEDGTALEGLPDMTPAQFCEFWCKGHGYTSALVIAPGTGLAGVLDHTGRQVKCRRIEWRYLDVCDFCLEPVADHSPTGLASCRLDLEALDRG